MIMFSVNVTVINIIMQRFTEHSTGKKINCKYFIFLFHVKQCVTGKQDRAEIQKQPHLKIFLLDLSFRDQLFFINCKRQFSNYSNRRCVHNSTNEYAYKLWPRRGPTHLSTHFPSRDPIQGLYNVYLSRHNSYRVRDNLYRSLRYKFMTVKLNLKLDAYDRSQNKVERFKFVLPFKRENQKYMKKKIIPGHKKAVNKT